MIINKKFEFKYYKIKNKNKKRSAQNSMKYFIKTLK